MSRLLCLALSTAKAARAFGQRTTTFMASAEWCKYLEDMPQRAHTDRLWPVVLRIPGLMQQVDGLDVTESTLSEVLALLQQIDTINLSLNTWLDAYKQDVPVDDDQHGPFTALPMTLELKLSPPVDFVTISEAEVKMTYWAYKLELSMLREQIEALQITTADDCPVPKNSGTSAHRFASLIGRSMAYWLKHVSTNVWLKHVSTDVCLFRLLYSVRLAWTWFARYPELYEAELAACRILRTKMKSVPKTGMAEFVMDLFYKPPPEETE